MRERQTRGEERGKRGMDKGRRGGGENIVQEGQESLYNQDDGCSLSCPIVLHA